MAASTELSSFVTKFYNLWSYGKCARLSVECEAGQAYMNLQLRLPGPHPDQQHGHAPQRPGPPRLRRRERPDQAQELAAAKAATQPKEMSDAAVQDVASTPDRSHTAVQADLLSPARADVAVQAALPVPPKPTVQAAAYSATALLVQDLLQEVGVDQQCVVDHHPQHFPDSQIDTSSCRNILNLPSKTKA